MGPPAQMISQRTNISRMQYPGGGGVSTGYIFQGMPNVVSGNMYSQSHLSQPSPSSASNTNHINGGGSTSTQQKTSRPLSQLQQQYSNGVIIQQQDQQPQRLQAPIGQTTAQFIQQQQTNVFQRGASMPLGYPNAGMHTNNYISQQGIPQQMLQQQFYQQLRNNQVNNFILSPFSEGFPFIKIIKIKLSYILGIG